MRHFLACLTVALAGTAAAEPFATAEFSEAEGWTPDHTRRLADVDGDGRADIVGFHDDGVWVALADEAGFRPSEMWSMDFGALDGWAGRDRFAADIDGDGKADLIGFAPDRVIIARSTGAGFEPADWTPVGANMLINGSFEEPALDERWRLIGDGGVPGWTSRRGPYIEVQRKGLAVDGAQHLELSTDQAGIARQMVPTIAGAEYQVQFAAGARSGLQENIIAAYWNNARLIRVAKDGRQASPDWEWHGFRVHGTGGDVPLDFHTEDYIEAWMGGYLDMALVRGPEPLICGEDACAGQLDQTFHLVEDVNGDGRADLIGVALDGVWVSLSFGEGFLPKTRWLADMAAEHGWQMPIHPRRVADVNGDGRADFIGVGHDGVHVAYSDGRAFEPGELQIAEMGYGHGWRPWSHPRDFADFDGDGRADLIGFSNNRTHVANGTPDGLRPSRVVGYGFGPVDGWDVARNPRIFGDVNGDGLADMVAFGADETIVRISDGTRLSAPRAALAETFATRLFTDADGYDPNRHRREVGDVNGDGRLDLVLFHERGTLVALGTGAGFEPPRRWTEYFSILQTWWTGAERYVADFNGDGLDDIIGFSGSDVMVALSDGQGFGPEFSVGGGYRGSYNHFGYNNPQFTRHVADFNGDGLADVAGFRADGVYVSLSDGARIGGSTRWLADLTVDHGWDATFEPRAFGDLDGDGMDDVIGFGRDGVVAAFSTGDAFEAPVPVIAGFGRDVGGWGGNHPRRLGDIDGDGDDDIIGFGSASIYVYHYVPDDPRPRTEIVSSAMTVVAGWRQRHDRFVGDVDGDGIDDIIGFGPAVTQVRLSDGARFTTPAGRLFTTGERWYSALRPAHLNACLWAPKAGGAVRQVRCAEGGWSLNWRLVVAADGTLSVRTPKGQCVRRTDGADLQAGVCDAQARWTVRRHADGSVQLQSTDDAADCMSVAGGSAQNNTPIRLEACADVAHQRWHLETLHAEIRTVRLKTDAGCLQRMTPVEVGACPGTDFELIETGDGEQIRNPHSGLCFAHVEEGELPVETPCAVEDAQLWRFHETNGGHELRARTYTGTVPGQVCWNEWISYGFGGFYTQRCEIRQVPVPPPAVWQVDGLGSPQAMQLVMHRFVDAGGVERLALVYAGADEAYAVLDERGIATLLAKSGVTLSDADDLRLFGKEITPYPTHDDEPQVIRFWYREGGDWRAGLSRSDWESNGETEWGYGEARVFSFDAWLTVQGRSADLRIGWAFFEVGGGLQSASGSQLGAGLSLGLGLGAGGSAGEDGVWGISFEVGPLQADVYFAEDDVEDALLFLGRQAGWLAENFSSVWSDVEDGFDIAGDWFGGAADALECALTFGLSCD